MYQQPSSIRAKRIKHTFSSSVPGSCSLDFAVFGRYDPFTCHDLLESHVEVNGKNDSSAPDMDAELLFHSSIEWRGIARMGARDLNRLPRE